MQRTTNLDLVEKFTETMARFTNSSLASAIASVAGDAFVRGQSIGDGGTDPGTDPTTSANPRGIFTTPNLSGPLLSLESGYAVADQLPETADHEIRVYFAPGSNTAIADGDSITTSSWSASEIDAALSAFEQFEAVANLEFIQVSNIENADFVMIETRLPGTLLGYFSVGDSSITVGSDSVTVNGYGVFSNAPGTGWTSDGLQPGGYGYLTLVHEIGHGLGLAHPHDILFDDTVMDGVSNSGDTGDFGLNQGVYTAMTYNDGWPDGSGVAQLGRDYGFVGGLMALDIAVIQNTYGANTTTGAGDTTYVIPNANTRGTFYSSIWDTSM